MVSNLLSSELGKLLSHLSIGPGYRCVGMDFLIASP
jgi:hypothetical protein